jgi:putative transposase
MARRPRFVLAGVPHHVTQRGNNRQDVFFCHQDRLRYLELLREHSLRHNVRILGWCLMTNHVHLILIPASAECLARTLGQVHSQYAVEQNRQQRRVGHLWQNRFFSCALEPAHLFAALHYVELNPVRAGMTRTAWDWPWSSARAHTSANVFDELLAWPWIGWKQERRLGGWNHSDWKVALGWAASGDQVEQIRRATRLGEPLGSGAFVRESEAKAGRRLRVWARGRPPLEKTSAAVGQASLFIE